MVLQDLQDLQVHKVQPMALQVLPVQLVLKVLLVQTVLMVQPVLLVLLVP